ncbi:hypothetical protein CF336_g9151, partial [Tilletia laevis]
PTTTRFAHPVLFLSFRCRTDTHLLTAGFGVVLNETNGKNNFFSPVSAASSPPIPATTPERRTATAPSTPSSTIANMIQKPLTTPGVGAAAVGARGVGAESTPRAPPASTTPATSRSTTASVTRPGSRTSVSAATRPMMPARTGTIASTPGGAGARTPVAPSPAVRARTPTSTAHFEDSILERTPRRAGTGPTAGPVALRGASVTRSSSCAGFVLHIAARGRLRTGPGARTRSIVDLWFPMVV